MSGTAYMLWLGFGVVVGLLLLTIAGTLYEYLFHDSTSRDRIAHGGMEKQSRSDFQDEEKGR
jgi:hypothetical protein